MLFFDGVLFLLLMFALFSSCALFALIWERKFPTPPLFIAKPTKKKNELTVVLKASMPTKTLDQLSYDIKIRIERAKRRDQSFTKEITDIIEITSISDTEPKYMLYYKENKSEDNLKISPRN